MMKMKKYLITDPKYYTSNPQFLIQKLLHVQVQYQPDCICLRDKTTSTYESLAKSFVDTLGTCKETKLYLHTDFLLASKLGCQGVHLPSHAFNDIEKAKRLNLDVIFSAHSYEEILLAEKLGADAVTISPIFPTPNKGEPLGLEKLKEINDKISIKCFALGGIVSTEQIAACKRVGVYGFASIRYFLD